MPEREFGTYGNWSSDVTDCVMDVNNRGRAHPAGVVAGAWLVGLVLQTDESGSVL